MAIDRLPSTDQIPSWFWEAVRVKSESEMVEVEECEVLYRRWGNQNGNPLLFVHGMYAHSRWWDFIAPKFLSRYDPVAMDLTGMGDSDFRYEYDGMTYANEISAVCDAAKLSDEVILVAHSFGGRMAVKACAAYPDRFKALVLVDTGIYDPEEPIPDYPAMPGGRAKVYPSREVAEARFRLYPPQFCANNFLLEYIAKQSLMPVEGGFCWKYDEDLPNAMTNVDSDPFEFSSLKLPVALIYGAKSVSFTEHTLNYTSSLISNLVDSVAIEDAQHHVFLDQPLKFIEVLEDVLGRLR